MIVSAIALLAVPRASAADDPEGDKRAGIEKAKNAGVMIDPNAEAAMAFAPIGTCANDPAQEKCPPAKAVVHVESDALGYYTLTSPGATARTASMRAPSCRFVHSAIYLTAGYLQGDATNECYHAIRRQELYGTLYKYYDGRWVPMVTRQQIRDNGRNSLDNARKTAVHPRHQCLQVPYRSWNFTASAWVLYQDVWYGDGGQSNQAFHCGWK